MCDFSILLSYSPTFLDGITKYAYKVDLYQPTSEMPFRWRYVGDTKWKDSLADKGLIPGRVAQSVTCLATDTCLTADPGVASSIPARCHTFVVIDHEIISTVILLPSADLFKKGCCQLQAKVCAQITD